MKKDKIDAIKKLLNLTDKQFNELQEKVLEDWAANLITTKSAKSVDELVTEINENIGAGTAKKTGRTKK